MKVAKITGQKVDGNPVMEESGWHHLNPPVKPNLTEGGPAEHCVFHVMYSYKA